MTNVLRFAFRSLVVVSVVAVLVAISTAVDPAAYGQYYRDQACYTSGAPQCSSCTDYPKSSINCNKTPPVGFLYGGCMTTGSGCSPSSLNCGGFNYACNPPFGRIGPSPVCTTTVSLCQ